MLAVLCYAIPCHAIILYYIIYQIIKTLLNTYPAYTKFVESSYKAVGQL